MCCRYEPLTDRDIEYVRAWASRYDVGTTFTLEGWKKFHEKDRSAPEATKVGGQVVEALQKNPPDPRLHFICLAVGPGRHGEIDEKKGNNAQYYQRKQ